MALNSVDPNSIKPEMPASSGDDNLMMKPPQTAIPSPNGVSNSDLAATQGYKGFSELTKATTEGDKAIAAAASKGGGGGGIGGILGSVGSILGGLFSQGGMVGMAEGGAVDSSNDPMAMGYMVGALHQQKYGGTPDTLEQAAQEIKQMMGGHGSPGPSDDFKEYDNQAREDMRYPGSGTVDMIKERSTAGKGYADGGISALSGPNGQLIEALGLSGQQSPQMPSQPQQGMMNNPAMGVPGQSPTAPQQAPMAPQGQSNMPQQNPAMRGFADGGPNMSMPPGQEQPPLSPGQAFQGDGEVKGPGGPTDDMIPAKLSNGEFVMSQPATAFFGVDKLIKMNEQGKQGFMQAKQQVDMNQPQQGGGAPPMAAPPSSAGPGMMMPPPPMPQEGMAKGGAAVMRTKGQGYCGL